MITSWKFQLKEGSAFIQIYLGMSPELPNLGFSPKVAATIREAKRSKHLLGAMIPVAGEATLFAYDPKDQTTIEVQLLELFGFTEAQVQAIIKNGGGKK